MKRLLVIIIMALICILPGKISAQTVDFKQASLVAKNFYYEKVSLFKNIEQSKIRVKDTFLKKSDSDLSLYYIFNMVPDGFVIISAQQNAFPVLGYAFEGYYDESITNPGLSYFLNLYSKQITDITNKSIDQDIKSIEFWNKYQSQNFTPENKDNTKSVVPLIFSNWNQDKYYNQLCPADAGGPDGHTYAGCVATALGQLMYYHRWPWTGTGSYSYNLPVYGTISADFGSTTYDWNQMTNSLTSYNQEIAKLLFHLGVSVDMDYGPNGSGMWNHHGALTLKTYFKYCPETRYVFRDSTTLNWDSLVITNIDNKKPLYYAGWEDTTFTAGHAFVCDGYQTTDFFHFNWGWGGIYNGYFYLNQLNPGGSNFNQCQELIVDIYPDTINYSYPINCTNGNQYSSMSGTFSDESGIQPYPASSNCSWLLSPTCGNSVKLSFDRFSLASGDTISVFNGANETSAVLAKYTTINPPITTESSPFTTIQSNSNNMYVVFTSDNNLESDGFNASYSVKFCNADTSVTPSGSLSDGSGSCDYEKSTSCRWYIMPPGAQSITLNFTEFDLATDNVSDYIRVYKNSISTGNVMATYDHLNPPTTPLTVQAPLVIIRFITNSTVQAGGWALDYSSSTLDISETFSEENNGIIVYPNPFKENAVIRFNSENSKSAHIKLYDLSGKFVSNRNILVNSSNTEISIQELCKNIETGCYLLNIATETKEYNIKVIKLPESGKNISR